MVAVTGPSPLLGRAVELGQLRAAFAAALAGSGRTILIDGEPGIGKTRLVEELVAEARARDVPALWARCVDGPGAPAYWPWTQIIRAAQRECDARAIRTALCGAAIPSVDPGQTPSIDPGQGMPASSRVIVHLVPELGTILSEPSRPRDADFSSNRFQRCEAVCAFLRDLARAAPLVLVIDDLQWADAPSMQLLQFAMRELGDAPVLLLGTCRDGEGQRGSALARTFAEASRLSGCERMTLLGLAQQDVGLVIAAITETTPPESLVADVYLRTEGNPFFVTEIVRSLPPDAWRGRSMRGLSIPASILDAIRGRLDRLSAACRRVLAVAAVMGREFNVGALEHVRDDGRPWADGEWLLDLLEEAERARIIVGVPDTPGRFCFTHELMREALYAAVPAGRLVRLHRQVGAALEAWYGEDTADHLAELAWHFFQAAPGGDVEKAIAYAAAAAHRAVKRQAYEDGAELFDTAVRALGLLPAPPAERRYKLLMLRGSAEVRAGRLDAAQETFLRAAALVRGGGAQAHSAAAQQLARAALGMQLTALTHGVVDVERVQLLEEALAALGDDDPSLRARLLARLAMELYYAEERERSAALSHDAVRLARSTGDPATLAFALQARRWAAWGPDSVAERLALGVEMVDLARTLGDRELLMAGAHTRFVALQEQGEMQAVAAEAVHQERLADELRIPYYQWHVAVYRAMRAVLDGSFGDGARLAQQALAYGKRADAPNAEQVYALHGALLLWHQGRLAEDEATVRQAADRYPALPIWRCLLALVACEREREDEARQLVEQLARGRFAGLPRDVFWLCNMALLSEACARLGNAGHAGMLYQHLAPYATRNVMAGRAACLGSVARYLGLLAATRGDRSASARHFEDALAALGRMGARPLDARTRYDYAAMLLGSDTVAASDACVEKGLALLEQARASARELGMPSLAQRAQRLEDDVSASRSPCRSSFPDRLTAREVTVLRLLATGHSNPQIASELVISVKTVERHTVNIYAKIGARNRVDAATYALRHSLV